MLLQETHGTKKIERRWKMEWGGQAFFSHRDARACGVAILIRKGVKTKVYKTKKDTEGRLLYLDFQIQNIKCTIINCYGPNNDSPEFYATLFEEAKEFSNENIIIGGDLNTSLSALDVKGTNMTNKKAGKMINEYIKSQNLVDVWRMKHPNLFQFTWKRMNPKPVMERLDYFLISENLIGLIKDESIQPSYLTDHSFPVFQIKTENTKGNGYWKLNTELLKNKDYIEQIREIIERLSHEHNDVIMRWELIKMTIRGHTIQYATRKKLSKQRTLSVLERKLSQLYKQQADTDLTLFGDIENQINLVQKDINEIRENLTSRAIKNCKEKWHDEGEKCTKYFLGLEQSRNTKRTIHKLKDKKGKEIYDEKKILEELENFYSSLYKSAENPFDPNYLNDINFPTLSDAEKLSMDQPISKDEIKIAISALNNNKCPGLDGFPIEFYKTFWNDISATLHSLYI